MELDLSEYDQMEEIITGKEKYFQNDSTSKLVVTLSSEFGHTNSECETNCENDFVFLPSFANDDDNSSPRADPIAKPVAIANSRPTNNHDTSSSSCRPPLEASINTNNQNRPLAKRLDITDRDNLEPATCSIEINKKSNSMVTWQQPYVNNNSVGSSVSSPMGARYNRFVLANKPVGPIKSPVNQDEWMSHSNRSYANKLADLMQQIVTRSDLIQISIPCQFCDYQIPCPPSDISSWLNHLNRSHCCKVCPICNRLVGLGPQRDLEIMRKHVYEHIDTDWLDARPNRVNFSFGLQQHWFSGYNCSVRDNPMR